VKVRIFLADDHAVVRDGLRMLLQAQRDFEVVGEAANGREALERAATLQPDVAILDIAMPELNGLEAARRMFDLCPGIQIIILSMHGTSQHVIDALRMGVRGYLLKASAGAEVVNAVHAVRAGRRYLSESIVDTVIDVGIEGPQQEGEAEHTMLARLSPREREVLQLVVEGRSSAEIAKIVFLSPKTVETYRSNLMKKLNISDLPALVKFAIKNGLTTLE
jgi:DNA-binding NarL/FixJ family response regulator